MKNRYIILGIILILVFSLTGCSTQHDTNMESISKKVNSELDYLDSQLLGMLNKLNNISFQRYLVLSEEITSDSASPSGNSSEEDTSEKQGLGQEGESGESSSKGSNSSKESSESSSSGGSGGSSTESSNESSSSGSSSTSTSNSMRYSMEPNNILNRNPNIDWASFNTDIENLYNAWSTITIDLYKKEIDNNLVLNFSADLQSALNSIKAKDKNSTLVNLAKLYSYIPQFSRIVNGENLKTNVLKTKASLLNAYALVEQDNWQRIQTELNNAEQNYMPILNGIISNQNKEYNINKAYILIKETRKKCKRYEQG